MVCPAPQELLARLPLQCPGSTVIIRQTQPITSLVDTPIRISQPNVTINAPQGLVINYVSTLPNTCGFEVAAPFVALNGISLGGKAGICVCSSATEGVRWVVGPSWGDRTD